MRHLLLLVGAALAAAAFVAVQVGGASPPGAISISPVGTYASGVPFDGDFGAAEIPAYDAGTKRVFVVNGQQQQIDVLDISTPSSPTLVGSIELDLRPNSVSARDGLVAVALEADVTTDPGSVAFYSASCDPASCPVLSTVEVGALPDMLTFTPNGDRVVVASEGEPDGAVDPKGTVSIIDVRAGVSRAAVATVDFTSLDGKPVPAGAILQAGKQPSRDFEPEYVTVSTNSRTAWVALQEANAIAEIDVADARLVAVRGLGFKDHGLAANSLDASDRDSSINMCAWTNVYGMYQPDAIAAYQVRGSFYVVSANEGDSRGADESRVRDLPSGAVTPTFGSVARDSRNLGRLTVNKNLGLENGVYTKLFAYGARSFSIWGEDGTRVFDSGNQLERIVGSFAGDPAPEDLRLSGPGVPAAKTYKCPIPTSEALPTAPSSTTPANANHEEGPSFDNRSDNKGPEPEAVTVGRVRGQHYAFVGLERAGGIVVYNVSDPTAPSFVEYVNPRSFGAEYELPDEPGEWADAGDLGPEGVVFVSEDDSPGGQPLLIVANEVSGTTTIYAISAG